MTRALEAGPSTTRPTRQQQEDASLARYLEDAARCVASQTDHGKRKARSGSTVDRGYGRGDTEAACRSYLNKKKWVHCNEEEEEEEENWDWGDDCDDSYRGWPED